MHQIREELGAKTPALSKETCMTFREDITSLINRYSMENGSDTPDFLLAEYLTACLAVFDKAVTARERWYGRRHGNPIEPYTPPEEGLPDIDDVRGILKDTDPTT
jgi:hypothetical protein